MTTYNSETCVFPFTYDSVDYYSCTYLDRDRPWCETTTGWGYCSNEIVANGGEMREGDRTSCVFPFLAGGEWYYTCVGDGNARPWCQTERFNETHWGYCDSGALYTRTAYRWPDPSSPPNGPEQAVDNSFISVSSVCSWTGGANTPGPWYVVDLGNAYSVNGVALMNVNDGYYAYLTMFYVEVGWYYNGYHTAPRYLYGWTTCADFTGVVPPGANVAYEILCDQLDFHKGQYVMLHMHDSAAWQYLYLCEIVVLGSFLGDIVGYYEPRPDWSAHLDGLPDMAGLGSGVTLVFDGNDNKFTAEGVVVGWVFYCARAGTMMLQVWRPSGSNHKLLSSHTYTSTAADVNSYVYVNMTGVQEMYVDQGDTLGISYPSTPPIRINSFTDAFFPVCVYYDNYNNPHSAEYVKKAARANFAIDEETAEFSDHTSDCVDFSVEAVANYFHCKSYPCLNGGYCIEDPHAEPDGYFRCQCTSYFTGFYCETNLDECESNPCVNGGTCNDDLGFYNCSCPVGYLGVYCEIEPPTTPATSPLPVGMTTIPALTTDTFQTTDDLPTTDNIVTTDGQQSTDDVQTTESVQTSDIAATTGVIQTTDNDATTGILQTTDNAATTGVLQTTDNDATTGILLTTDNAATTGVLLTTDNAATTGVLQTTDNAATTGVFQTTDNAATAVGLSTTDTPATTGGLQTSDNAAATGVLQTTDAALSTDGLSSDGDLTSDGLQASTDSIQPTLSHQTSFEPTSADQQPTSMLSTNGPLLSDLPSSTGSQQELNSHLPTSEGYVVSNSTEFSTSEKSFGPSISHSRHQSTQVFVYTASQFETTWVTTARSTAPKFVGDSSSTSIDITPTAIPSWKTTIEWKAHPYIHEFLYQHRPSEWRDPDKRLSAIIICIIGWIFVGCEMTLFLIMDIQTCYKERKRIKKLHRRTFRKVHPKSSPNNESIVQLEKF